MKEHLLASLLLLLGVAQATYVYGDIYRVDTLEKINHTLIRIEGPYTYQMVSQKTNYSFDLPEGEYQILAQQLDGNGNPVLNYENSIRVGAQNQQMDLVLRPVGPDWKVYAGVAGGLLLLTVGMIWKIRTRQKRKAGTPREQEKPTAPAELDEDARKVLQVLATMENRATQKELRGVIGFSEAKLSLILAELEQLGQIKKFKRGRGNIIRKLES